MEDPLTSMIDKCRISSSQENLLDRSLFAFESQEGLITPLTQEESSSYPDDIPVDNTGILICSPPDGSGSDESSSSEGKKYDENNPLVEEYHTPPEERGLDELTVDDDRDVVYRDADAVLDASQGTVDLGKDSFGIVSSQGKSFEVNSSQFVGTVCVDDVEKPCDNEESRVNVEGIGESESNLHTDEDLGLGFIEPKITDSEGLNKSPNKNLIESPKNLSLDIELNSEEDSVVDIAEKTLESLVNKNLGFLKCNPNNPYDCESMPPKSVINAIPCASEYTNPNSSEVVTSVAVENEEGVDVNTSKGQNVEPSSKNLKENLPVIAIRKDIEEVIEVTIDAQEVREESEAAQKCNHIAISSPVRTGNAFDDPVLPDSSKDVVMNDLPSFPADMENMEMNAVKEIVLNSQPNNSTEDIIVATPQCIKDVEMEDLTSTAPAKDIGEVVDEVTLAGQKVSKESVPDQKDVVMTDLPLIPDEHDLGNETNGRVSGFENPLTDELHNDDKESRIKSADEVEKSECADSTDFSSGPLRNSPALRRLPNWAERESNSAAEGSNRSGNSRAGRVESFDLTGNIRGNTEDMRLGDDIELVKKLRDISHFMANLQKPVGDKVGDNPEEEKEDILEIATKAGLNIPRPRWWRPEGYET